MYADFFFSLTHPPLDRHRSKQTRLCMYTSIISLSFHFFPVRGTERIDPRERGMGGYEGETRISLV